MQAEGQLGRAIDVEQHLQLLRGVMKEQERLTVELATVRVESAVEGRSSSRWVEMEEVRDE